MKTQFETIADQLHATYTGPTAAETKAAEAAAVRFWSRIIYGLLLSGLGVLAYVAFNAHLVMSF